MSTFPGVDLRSAGRVQAREPWQLCVHPTGAKAMKEAGADAAGERAGLPVRRPSWRGGSNADRARHGPSRAAAFSGIELDAYVALDNHFHVVCKVVRTDEPVPEDELLRRVAVLKGERAAEELAEHWRELRAGIVKRASDYVWSWIAAPEEPFALLRRHVELTSSPKASRMLASWSRVRSRFAKVAPTCR